MRKYERVFLDGWNAGLEEMLDLIEEMQSDTKNRNTLKALQEIETWINGSQNYYQLLRKEK
jgi:hypothetical protein